MMLVNFPAYMNTVVSLVRAGNGILPRLSAQNTKNRLANPLVISPADILSRNSVGVMLPCNAICGRDAQMRLDFVAGFKLLPSHASRNADDSVFPSRLA